MQMSSSEERRVSQNSHELPVDHQELKMPFSQGPDDCAQNTGARKINDKEFQQPAKVSLPSFTQRLVVYNVQDSVGNTCGALFVSSTSNPIMSSQTYCLAISNILSCADMPV